MNRNIPKIAAILSLSVSLSFIGQPANAKASFSPLKKGMRNAKVQEVEKMLAALKFDYKLKVDKYYNKFTAANVKKFQKKYKLKQTGVVDKKTLASIKQQYAKLKKADKVKKPDPQVPLPSDLTTDEKEMIQLLNKERADKGLSPLQVDMKLENVARVKAQDMVKNGYFNHNSPTYGTPFQMMKSFGINYRSAAENLAQNWTVSAGHKMLMNPSYEYVAVAIVDGGPYGKTFVQMFVEY
jgi:uncharacterized protein YkwD